MDRNLNTKPRHEGHSSSKIMETLVPCPRGDSFCEEVLKLRLHEDTAEVACSMMCFSSNKSDQDLEKEIVSTVSRINRRLKGMDQALRERWFELLLEDLSNICPEGNDSEVNEYDEFKPRFFLSTPERALKASVILGHINFPEVLGVMRKMALMAGTWTSEAIWLGDYTTERQSSEFHYDRIDSCIQLYLDHSIRLKQHRRLIDELEGPLSEYAFNALVFGDCSVQSSTAYGSNSCQQELLSLYPSHDLKKSSLDTETLDCLRTLYLDQIDQSFDQRGPGPDNALRFFAVHPDLVTDDLLMRLFKDAPGPYSASEILETILKKMAANPGSNSFFSGVFEDIYTVMARFNSPDHGIPDMLAEFIRISSEKPGHLDFLSDQAAHAGKSPGNDDILIEVIKALDDEVLNKKLSEMFDRKSLGNSIAKRLSHLISSADSGQKSGFIEELKSREIHATIQDLSSPVWKIRRDAIQRLFSEIPASAEAKKALTGHLKNEADYELKELISRKLKPKKS